MDLLGLTYFCDAARSENFSATAKRFLVPTSNISQVIKRLELELGAPLFDRRGNKVQLNERGKRFYEGIKQALDIIDEAKSSVSLTDSEAGEIRLLVLTNRRTVADVIDKFSLEHPAVSFYMSHNASDSAADFDVIISDTLPAIHSYERQHLVREKLLLAARAGSPLAKCGIPSAEALCRERYISMSDESSLSKVTQEVFKSLGISPAVSIKCDDPSLIQRYVELGLGIAIVPSVSWSGVFSDKIKLIDIGEFYRDTYVYYKKAKHTPERVKSFVEALRR